MADVQVVVHVPEAKEAVDCVNTLCHGYPNLSPNVVLGTLFATKLPLRLCEVKSLWLLFRGVALKTIWVACND